MAPPRACSWHFSDFLYKAGKLSSIIPTMKKASPWLMLLVSLIAMVTSMRLQGRLWICSCGYVLPWSGEINSAGNSQHLFDPYTFTHIIHGFMFIALMQLTLAATRRNWKLVGALSLEAVWEAIENASYIINRYRSETVSLGYTGDTVVKSLGDIVACAIGVVLAKRLGVVRTIYWRSSLREYC